MHETTPRTVPELPSGWRIRPIQPEDDAVMAVVIREVMTEFGAVGEGFSIEDPEVDGMSAAYAPATSAYFVVTFEDRVQGGAGIGPLEGADADVCELKKMYVRPLARGKGVGRALLSLCLEAARVRGFRRCYLETLTGMEGAQRLYEAAGFGTIDAPLGNTGHFGCNRWYTKEISDR